MDEVSLIESARGGDLESFNRLVLAYQDVVFNQAYRVLGDHQAADDASQETFIAAFNNLKHFRGGSFKAWLLRIVTNTCYDELRRKKRRPTTSLEPLDDSGDEIESPNWIADQNEGPEEIAERVELGRTIQNCLDNLPLEFRIVVTLVDIQGMDYSEAADAIGKPLGTVKSRLARGRLRLRDCLQGLWELLPVTMRLKI
jgi:RNA polymerase sigma-70 factor (ECF subfamily)